MAGRIAHQKKNNRKPLETPPEVVDGFRTVLKGGVALADLSGTLQVVRTPHHGHAAATLGTARRIGLERILHRSRSRKRDLALAAIAARIIAPDSKLATARRLSPETADSSLGSMLGLGQVSGNEMLDMLDWLRQRQPWIEKSLANRHLGNGTLILYDVSSSYVEGRCCPLAAFGHNRDGKKGKKQITFGLLCATDGCPVAVEAYKNLSKVERGFRHMKTDLRVRPIRVRTGQHVRGHVFLCMLSHYVEWHMRRRLAPLLFQDDDPEGARAQRSPPVGKAEVSERAKRKADTKRTGDGYPVHSFRTLLDDLSSVVLNRVCIPGGTETELAVVTTPTRLQAFALELLDVNPGQFVPIRMAG